MRLKKKGNPITLESAGYGPGGGDPDVTVLTNGNMVVVWSERLSQPTDMFSDTDGAVFARVLGRDGYPVSDIIQVNESETFLQDRPEVVALSNGGFTVGWTNTSKFGDSATDTDTFLRSFDATGVATQDFMIDIVQDTPGGFSETASNRQVLHELVALDGNRFAAILENDSAYIYTTAGKASAILSNLSDDMVQLTNGNILRAVQYAGANGKIKLTLTDDRFGSPEGIAGVHGPLSFFVNGNINAAQGKNNLELASLADGGFALAFTQGSVQPRTDSSIIRLEFFSGEAVRLATADPISRSYSFDSTKGQFDMISLSGGGVALAMVDKNATDNTSDIEILLFDKDGKKQGDPIQVGNVATGHQTSPSLAELPDGTIALTYSDSSAAYGNPLQMAFFTVSAPREKLVGTAGNDDLGGLSGKDRILGLGGDDTIVGRGGHDVLLGGGGADTLRGGLGSDTLRGESGNDKLYGGRGNDGLGGGSGNDVLYGESGRDILGGHKGNDILKGGWGNDILRGGQNSDTLTGGPGEDVFVFVNGHSGMDVITDFDAAADAIRIDLRGAKASDLSVSKASGDTRITLDDIDITLNDVLLTESDIEFQFM